MLVARHLSFLAVQLQCPAYPLLLHPSPRYVPAKSTHRKAIEAEGGRRQDEEDQTDDDDGRRRFKPDPPTNASPLPPISVSRHGPF